VVMGVNTSMTMDIVQAGHRGAGMADLVIRVDGTQPPSAEAIAG
jgi:hypothetical protein